ncbi:dihydropyrimidinase [Svornostia abyssi]|uniref:Dihydropyrimidinase n=1 Tax=Svornostia abyssi TaxID=2898438 RepID=A0ABY5PEH8_9ACTN|nr:dihydropyrimidinase [Parviterribacteraceae bacterium J379]
MRTLIRGGRVVTAGDDYTADVLIEGERITQLGANLLVPADRVIDATDRYVLPGGVDTHTHLASPSAGTVTCDDFFTGTVAAAFGGTTTIVDFATQFAGVPFADAVATWEANRTGKAVIDVGFHLAVTDLEGGGGVDALAAMVDAGVPSWKLFMAYKGAIMVDDDTLLRVMQTAADAGALVLVHAEHGDAIDVLTRQALAAGRTGPDQHAATRPPEAEAEATNRAINLARIAGCDLFVVHVSCGEALASIRRAREAGWRVWAETCPQYLFCDESQLSLPDFEGAKYTFSPPPRHVSNQPLLWRALADGALDQLTTDHCPFRWADQKAMGRDDFSKIPNGAPGIEQRLMLAHHFGVREGRISLQRMVDVLSTTPARLFGLAPRKGSIAVGADADVVVFDPAREHTISAATHHSAVDYNLYEGMTVVGAPETVLVRGTPVIEQGRLTVGPGHGRFVPRAPFRAGTTHVAEGAVA